MSAITHLQFLESEAIYILRETAAQFQKPALLFSGGKDSIVMAWLARKAFYPSKLPFPLLHVDTGHNFPEAMTYRDWFVNEIGAKLTVGSVQKSIDDGKVQEEKSKDVFPVRDLMRNLFFLHSPHQIASAKNCVACR